MRPNHSSFNKEDKEQHGFSALETIALQAGPIRLDFEPATCLVRRIRIGSHELVRAIYAAVRDEAWGTYKPVTELLETEIGPESFSVSWLSTTQVAECLGELTGDEDGTLTFEVRFSALESFATMRTGVCVLHPIQECRGRDCVIEHHDGSIEKTHFPDLIVPYQPFFGIRTIEHGGPGETRVRIEFEGEIFETEDQRNWTDASFKTYSRPLAYPAPYAIKEGEHIEQSVKISLRDRLVPSPETSPEQATLRVGPRVAGSVPKLGTMLSPAESFDQGSLRRLRTIGFSHLGVKLNLNSLGDWRLLETAAKIGIPIEWHVQGSAQDRDGLKEWVRRYRDVETARILLASQSPGQTCLDQIDLIRELFGDSVSVLGAAASNFTELNRDWPNLNRLSGVGFALNPQVHIFDSLSVMETTSTHSELASQAKAFVGSKQVAVGPITLEPAAWADRKPDPRLHSEFGAAWTLASLSSLTTGGADSATYFETHGGRGILSERESDPWRIEELFRWVCRFQECPSWEVTSDIPWQAQALMLQGDRERVAALSNLTGDRIRPTFQSVRFEIGPFDIQTVAEGILGS